MTCVRHGGCFTDRDWKEASMSWNPVDHTYLDGQPVAFAHNGRVEVLARSRGGDTSHWTFDPRTGVPTRRELRGRISRDPAIVRSNQDPRMFVIFTDPLALGELTLTAQGWTEGPLRPFPAAPPLASAPQAVWSGSVIDVFYTTPTADGLATPVHYSIDTTTLQITLDPHFAAADLGPARFEADALIRPAVVDARPYFYLVLYARGPNNHLWVKKCRSKPNGAPSWTAWTMHDKVGVLSSDPLPVVTPRATYVFVRGSGHGLHYTLLDRPGDWRDLGGEFAAPQLSAALGGQSELHVVVRGPRNDVWAYPLYIPSATLDVHLRVEPPRGLGGETLGVPSIAYGSGDFAVFVRGLSEELWLHRFSAIPG